MPSDGFSKVVRTPKSAPGDAGVLSRREFAARDGCDESAVRKAIKSGHLKTLPGGGLSAALVGTGWRARNRRSPKGADSGADQTEVRTASPHPESAPAASAEPATLEEVAAKLATMDTFAEDVLAGRYASLAEAERIKENALALKHLVAVRRDSGELVEIAAAEQVLFEEFRAMRNAWLNWPAKAAPHIAAATDIDAGRLVDLLAEHVHAQLAELGEPDADFRPSN